MTESETIRIARQVCTPKQLEVMELYEQGLGYRQIARRLRLGVTTVRDRLDRGTDRVDAAKAVK
jgi:DNA-binding NarL/FixJ family response regulator